MEELHISRPTLKVWKYSGKIKFKQLSEKLFFYDIDSILKTKGILYGRFRINY
jgi:predicted site-specific integrase-resolvase